MAAILLFFLIDSTGCRRLDGSSFAVTSDAAKELRAIVERLASPEWEGRKPGTDGNRAAATYLEGELKKRGVEPVPSFGSYRVPLDTMRLGDNIIAWIPGEKSDGVILLGAHFDHLGRTKDGMVLGADDNASSVAVVLGAIDRLRETKHQHSIAIAFFNTEEAPYFGSHDQGSRELAHSPPREIGALSNIRLAIVLDLIGGVAWRPFADTVFACGAEKSAGLAPIVDATHEDGLDVRRLGIHLVEDIPGYERMPVSDYDIFRNRGVPYLFLSSGRTHRYHKPADVASTLHYERMAKTSAWIAKLVAAVDQRDERFDFDAKGQDLEADRTNMRWAASAAIKPWSTVPGTGPLSYARLVVDRFNVASDTADALALERASFRIQCLVYDYPVCFSL